MTNPPGPPNMINMHKYTLSGISMRSEGTLLSANECVRISEPQPPTLLSGVRLWHHGVALGHGARGLLQGSRDNPDHESD